MEITLTEEEMAVIEAVYLADLAGEHIDTAAREAVPHLVDRLYWKLAEGLEELGLINAALMMGDHAEFMAITRTGKEVALTLLGSSEGID